MKIAISGKGGVGKTTVSSLLIKALNNQGKKILAVDADPDTNLAFALGFKKDSEIPSISDLKKIIFKRTKLDNSNNSSGGFFKLNPKVDDIPDNFSMEMENIKLIKLGTISRWGSGCLCPESAFLKALISHIILGRNEWVVVDMEAGIEHLGRATAGSVDRLLIVVEPGYRSIETAKKIIRLSYEIKIANVSIVGNKIRDEKDEMYIRDMLSEFEILDFIRYNQEIIEADLSNKSPYESSSEAKNSIFKILKKISE